ncbi:unnamed protein product, partial [Rhizoctonia solani]
ISAETLLATGVRKRFNTEAPEHLHIEFAKVPWRASNKVKPTPQMITYTHRQEAIRIHCAYLDRYLTEDRGGGTENIDGTSDINEGPLETVRPPRIDSISDGAGTPSVWNDQQPVDMAGVPRPSISTESVHHPVPSYAPFDPIRRDVVCASAPTGRTHSRESSIWDVALYLEKPNRICYRAGRVRAFFTLPENLRCFYSGPLAYLELFTPFDVSVSPFNKLHTTKPDFDSHGDIKPELPAA